MDSTFKDKDFIQMDGMVSLKLTDFMSKLAGRAGHTDKRCFFLSLSFSKGLNLMDYLVCYSPTACSPQ